MRMLGKVISVAKDVGKFDETVLFRGENANVSSLSLPFCLWVHLFYAALLNDCVFWCVVDVGSERGVQGAF